MGQYKYITRRMLLNRAGVEKGKILVVVKTGSDGAEADYTCPECGHCARAVQPWKRPFSMKCAKCGFLMKLAKLKNKK